MFTILAFILILPLVIFFGALLVTVAIGLLLA